MCLDVDMYVSGKAVLETAPRWFLLHSSGVAGVVGGSSVLA